MESTIKVGSADAPASRWLPESLPPVQPGDLVEFSETGFHIAGRCLEGPDGDGWYLVESLAELHHAGGYDDTPAHIGLAISAGCTGAAAWWGSPWRWMAAGCCAPPGPCRCPRRWSG